MNIVLLRKILMELDQDRKPEESLNKHGEVEPTSSSLINRCSPDDTSSDQLQEMTPSNVQAIEQPEGIKPLLTNRLDDVTSKERMSLQSSSNGYTNEDKPLEVNPEFFAPSCDQIDCKVFSPDQSHFDTELAQYLGSPFSNEFGNDYNGLLFHDGSSERDVSLPELFEEVFNNPSDVYCEEYGQPLTEQHFGVGERPVIKFGTRQHQPQEGTVNSVVQGSAPRRICLIMDHEEGETVCSEDEEVESAVSEANSIGSSEVASSCCDEEVQSPSMTLSLRSIQGDKPPSSKVALSSPFQWDSKAMLLIAGIVPSPLSCHLDHGY